MPVIVQGVFVEIVNSHAGARVHERTLVLGVERYLIQGRYELIIRSKRKRKKKKKDSKKKKKRKKGQPAVTPNALNPVDLFKASLSR